MKAVNTLLLIKIFLLVKINSIDSYAIEDNISEFNENFNRSLLSVTEDSQLNVPELIYKYGYPVEIHTIQTPDGYLLEVHRIPKHGGIPVLLQHGILDSSAGWVVSGPQSAFAYMLSDLGYDVWLGNARGNTYSKKHTYLSPKGKEFWDFSFHEIGSIDIPAMIDYILQKTNHKKLHYIAHSQGSTSFWVMCHQRPEYCDKIISMHALAPVAFLQNMKSPLLKFISFFLDQLRFLTKFFGMGEFFANNKILSVAGQLLCKETAITQDLCVNAIFLITGYDTDQLNKTMLPAILGHIPAGGSTKQLIHFGQLVKSGLFRMYDYGWLKNWSVYRKLYSPSYDLRKVTAPVALHYSLNDWLADPKDVQRLSEMLPNVIGRYLVPLPQFNHLDFLFAISSRKLVYERVVKVMKKME